MNDAVVANNLYEILNLGCNRKMSFIEWINSESGFVLFCFLVLVIKFIYKGMEKKSFIDLLYRYFKN